VSARRKILVVDDSPTVRASAQFVLENAGYDVVVVDTPFGFARALNAERPDLVLMDVSMPGLRGDKLLEIGQRYEPYRCPIVLFSSQPVEELSALVSSLGLAGFIPKDLNLLLAEIPKYLP
jgi:CheY-like chemotaxis protein